MDIERFRPQALATALALLGDHPLAEDAVQDAFVEALRGWDTCREPEKRAAWVRAIVRHRCFRTLRRRDLGSVPLPELVSEATPAARAAEQEERRHLLARVRALPRHLREVVALHYLSGCTHRETAAFLGVPATTVNNRLHLARRFLKGGPAVNDIPHAGTVIAVDGPFVDVTFPPDGAPEVFDVLSPASAEPGLRVVQALDDGTLRCLRLRGDMPAVGERVIHTTADGGTYMAVAANADDLAAMTAALDAPCIGLRETGIKPVDLFCPLPQTGTVATMGTSGTGKMVLTIELIQRLGGTGPHLACLAARREPALIRDLRDEVEEFDRRVLWVVTPLANDPDYADRNDTFDAVAYTSPLLAVRGLWPALDPLHSRSRVETSDRHARLAEEARAVIRDLRSRTLDPVLLEYLAVDSIAAARRWIAEREDPDDEVVQRGRRLEAFLTHPFDIGKAITGVDGETVPLAATLDGVEAILRGDLDDTAVDDLMFIGALRRG